MYAIALVAGFCVSPAYAQTDCTEEFDWIMHHQAEHDPSSELIYAEVMHDKVHATNIINNFESRFQNGVGAYDDFIHNCAVVYSAGYIKLVKELRQTYVNAGNHTRNGISQILSNHQDQRADSPVQEGGSQDQGTGFIPAHMPTLAEISNTKMVCHTLDNPDMIIYHGPYKLPITHVSCDRGKHTAWFSYAAGYWKLW